MLVLTQIFELQSLQIVEDHIGKEGTLYSSLEVDLIQGRGMA